MRRFVRQSRREQGVAFLRHGFSWDAGCFEGENCSASLLGQEVEIAGEKVQAGEFWLDENFRGEAELDGVDFVEAEDMFIQRRQREFGNQIEASGDAVGVGNDLVISGGKLRAASARAGVRVDREILERGVGRHIEGEKSGERASKAVSADGDRGDGPGKRKSG